MVSEHAISTPPPRKLLVNLAFNFPIEVATKNNLFAEPYHLNIAEFMKSSRFAQAELPISDYLFIDADKRCQDTMNNRNCTHGKCYLIMYDVENELEEYIITWQDLPTGRERYSTSGKRSLFDPKTALWDAVKIRNDLPTTEAWKGVTGMWFTGTRGDVEKHSSQSQAKPEDSSSGSNDRCFMGNATHCGLA